MTQRTKKPPRYPKKFRQKLEQIREQKDIREGKEPSRGLPESCWHRFLTTGGSTDDQGRKHGLSEIVFTEMVEQTGDFPLAIHSRHILDRKILQPPNYRVFVDPPWSSETEAS